MRDSVGNENCDMIIHGRPNLSTRRDAAARDTQKLWGAMEGARKRNDILKPYKFKLWNEERDKKQLITCFQVKTPMFV